MSIEKFIDDVVEEVKEIGGYEKVCINNIMDYYPDKQDEAVESCLWLTMYHDEPSELPDDIQEEFIVRDYIDVMGIEI